MAENTWGLVHVEWERDDDMNRIEETREQIEARAAKLNSEGWTMERWYAAPLTETNTPPGSDPKSE